MNEPTTVADLIHVIASSRLRIVVVTTLTFALVLLYLATCPRVYQSEAKLLLRVGRESVTLDPTAAFGEVIGMQQNRQTEINSVTEVLQSRAICEQVVRQLGSEVVLGGGDSGPPEPNATPSLVSQVKGYAKRLLGVPRVGERETAIRSLRDSVEFGSGDFSNVITITASAESAEFARVIADTYCEVFIEEHVRLHHTETSLTFFRDQMSMLSQSLADAESKVRDAKNAYSLLSVDGRRLAIERQLGLMQEKLRLGDVDIASSESIVKTLGTQLGSTPEKIITESRTGIANPATDGMRQRLYELEIEERKMQQQYSDDHPKMKALQQQLIDVRRILDRQKDENRVEETLAINDEYRRLKLAHADETAKLAALKSSRIELVKQIDQLSLEATQLNRQEPELLKLQRNLDDIRRNYEIHSKSLEQARVDGALASSNITNVKVFQEATLEEKPAKPRFGITIALGFIASLFAGLFSAVMRLSPVKVFGRTDSDQVDPQAADEETLLDDASVSLEDYLSESERGLTPR